MCAFLSYVKTHQSVVLDYSVKISPLKEVDRFLTYGEFGNFSVAGFEMLLQRHFSHYLITYYLPSGEKRMRRFVTIFDFQDCLLLSPGSVSLSLLTASLAEWLYSSRSS